MIVRLHATYSASILNTIPVIDTSRIWNSPYTGQIRLARGQYSNQGLLEVYCNGQWGTVCDDFFGTEEATVACRQLGYNGYYSSNRLSM